MSLDEICSLVLERSVKRLRYSNAEYVLLHIAIMLVEMIDIGLGAQVF
jgi:hypothetical protein